MGPTSSLTSDLFCNEHIFQTGRLELNQSENWLEVFQHEGQSSTPTFQRESVVRNSIAQILPHHIFYILQSLRLQWGVEACPLWTITQETLLLSKLAQQVSIAHCTFGQIHVVICLLCQLQQSSPHLEEVELIIVQDSIIVQIWHFEDSSQGFYTKWLHLKIIETNQKSQKFKPQSDIWQKISDAFFAWTKTLLCITLSNAVS